MSSATGRGPGRPSGRDGATLERARRIQVMEKAGISFATIAECEKCSEVYARLLARAPLDQPPDQASNTQHRAAPEKQRLNERTLTYRAVLALRRDSRLRRFDPARKLFWLDCVLEIYALGDADGLPIGQDGDPFESHAEFAAALGGDPDDVEAFLRRGLLTRLPDGGIDLPVKIGLKPKEPPRVLLPNSAEQPLAQAYGRPFEVFEGGQIDETENAPMAPNRSGIDETTITPSAEFLLRNSEAETPISVSPEICAATSTAAAAAKEDQSLKGSSSTVSPAGPDETTIGVSVSPDETEIARNEKTKINLQRSPVDILTDELATLAKLERMPTDQDRASVKGWVDDGYSVLAMRDNIAFKLKVLGGKPPIALRYFDKRLREKYKPGREQALSVATVEPPAALPEPEMDEPILGNEPLDQWARVDRVVRDAIGKPVHNAWMRTACFGGIDDGEVTIKFPHGFTRDHVRQHFELHLLRAWQAENPEIRRVEMVVEGVRRDGPG